MPRNGSGQYNPLTNTWNPPVTGVLATGADFQAQLNDISAAITQSVSKDGQTPMTANLPMGNNSIVGIASGTAASPSISANGDTNTGLYFPAADTVAIATGGTERARIDSTGNVGIGTSSPTEKLDVNGLIKTSNGYLFGSSANYLYQSSAQGVTFRIGTSPVYLSLLNSAGLPMIDGAGGALGFATAGSERMRIDSSGNVGIGTSSPSSKLHVYTSSAEISRFTSTATNGGYLVMSPDNATTTYIGSQKGILSTGNASDFAIVGTGANNMVFGTNSVERARITSDGNLLVGYNTSNGGYKLQVNSQIFATSSTIATSDGRYKENITPLDGALNLVKALNPVQFSWKEHPVHAFDTEVPTVGFIAQELQQVLSDRPYLNSIIKCNECTITAAEYETIEIEPAEEEIKDEDGNVLVSAKPAITEQRLVKPAVTEKFLGIAEGNLIAILTKAIQEQQVFIESQKTAIESLTARISALEAK